jgi:hypothetical protein
VFVRGRLDQLRDVPAQTLRSLVRRIRWLTVVTFFLDQAPKVAHQPAHRRLPPSGLERGHQIGGWDDR